MEYNKEAIKALKSAIKLLVIEQRQIKPQRKTVHFTGDRTMPPWKAQATHLLNRFELRYMYLAYGLMRGKTILQMEVKSKEPAIEKYITKVIEKYESENPIKQVVCSDQEGSAVS